MSDPALDVQKLGFAPDLRVAGYYQMVRAFVKLGVFDACADQPRSSQQLAERCGIVALPAFERLLSAAVDLGFFVCVGGLFELGPYGEVVTDPERKAWLLHRHMEADWFEHLGPYLQTGESRRFHDTMSSEDWKVYQEAFQFMRSGAKLAAMTFANDATRILDIGGASGVVVKPVLDRYPRAVATIIDFPEVVRMMDGKVNTGVYAGRLAYQVGDARTLEIPTDTYDVVIIANLLHHLPRRDAEQLLRRAARALPAGGSLAVLHGFMSVGGGDGFEKIGSLLFTLSSGEEDLPYEAFCALLAAEGLAPPRTSGGWQLSTKHTEAQ
ncbi:methyltransferase [soil metagenome]